MVKNYDIVIPKQDYQIIELRINEGQELSENDLIFMTVKRYATDTKIVFQKSLESGISYNQETEKYEIEITSNDTKDMEMKTEYGYDITIYYDGDKPKQKVIGKFKIGDKYTLNEVV